MSATKPGCFLLVLLFRRFMLHVKLLWLNTKIPAQSRLAWHVVTPLKHTTAPFPITQLGVAPWILSLTLGNIKQPLAFPLLSFLGSGL